MLRTAGLCLLLCASAAWAGDDAFRRAEMQERGLGDLERAAELYLEASGETDDVADRMRAEIRAASCLRRLGKTARALELLRPIAASGDGVPAELRLAAASELARAEGKEPLQPEAPAAGADAGALDVVRGDLQQTRLELEAALTRAETSEKDLAALARRLQEKDRELEALREELPPPEPTSAEEVLRRRREELEGERSEAKAASRVFTDLARRFHRSGEFADSREFLYAALEKDPENVEAKALLARVSAPLGDRERLYHEILAVLALAREVRSARLTAEVRDLVREARTLQQRGEHGSSMIPLEHASALLEASAAEVRAPEDLAREVTALLREAEAAGAPRTPLRYPPQTTDVAEWMPALRALLASAGAEVSHGLRMRFLDLDAVLSSAAGSLPPSPVGAPVQGWRLSGERVPADALLVAYLRETERQAFAAPGASLTSVGDVAVVLADEAAQRRLFERVTRLGLAGDVSVDVRVALYRAGPGRAEAILRPRGLAVRAGGDGSRVAVVPAADLAELEQQLADDPRRALAAATFRATPFRVFRLRGAASPLRVEILPVPGPAGGAAVRVDGTLKLRERSDSATLRQETVAAAELTGGAGLVVFGMADPTEPGSDLVTVVQVGSNLVDSAAPLPPTRPDTPKPPAQRSGELRLPDELLAIEEGAPPLPGFGGAPVPGRRDALLAHLRRRAVDATLVDLQDGRILVVGPESAHEGARGFVDDLSRVAGLQRFEVRMHELAPDVEKRLLRTLSGWNAVPNAAFAWLVVADSASQRGLAKLLETDARELALVEPRPAAPPTARADVVRVVRSLFVREIDTTSGPQPSWGRTEKVWVDEGVLLSLRPFGVGSGHRGRVPLDVSVRAAGIRETVAGTRKTPLGTVPLVQPAVANLVGDVSTTLADGEVLVFAAMANPFGRGSERTHLVVQIRVLR